VDLLPGVLAGKRWGAPVTPCGRRSGPHGGRDEQDLIYEIPRWRKITLR